MLKDPIQKLFALCAHIEQTDQIHLHLLDAVRQITQWEDVPIQAEEHGMAPLLNYHLRKSGVKIHTEVQRDLTGLALRHRLINQVRTRILSEMTSIFNQSEVPFFVLKGAALAHMLYPNPDLRPMKDMDILIKPEHIDLVTDLLKQLGYQQKPDSFLHPSELHLPTFTRQEEGFHISVEVHHRLLPENSKKFWGYLDKFSLPPFNFSISKDTQVKTLSKEEFLYHLCKHTFFSYHVLEPIRMIWVADICNFSEKFVDDIDWKFVKNHFPLVQHTLAALHEILPLSTHLLTSGEIHPRINPEKVISTYQGWPGVPLRDVKKQDYWRWFKDTCFPSGWVIFLHYGNGRFKAKWYNWLKHVMNLVAITKQHMKIRLNTKI
ncbi:MAG: nucleotidyltransferase family protein [Anaerolineaceae bacterium]|nr:nucleotidyltransferase family protein [Anaerolineaceae bacterium]